METGHTPSRKKPEYWGGDIPWIGIKDATGNHGRIIFETLQTTNELGIANSSARVLPAGTVCLSRTASVGYVLVMGRPMATSQDFVNWVCGEDLNPHFLKYLLLAERESLDVYATGSVHQTIYFPEVKAFHICMPTRDEQDRIVEALGTLDEKIELNRRMNETLEAMARALFKDWFVDFGPVRTKQAGAPAYLAPEIWDLFPADLDDEGLPLGWREGVLADLAMAKNEKADPTAIDSATPYIGLEHMPRHSIALDQWEPAAKVTSSKSRFSAGDILFGKLRPYFHKVGVAPVSGVCSTDIVVVRGRESHDQGFVAACLSSDDFVAYTDRTSTGTKMPRTSWKIMAQYPVVLADARVRQTFNELCSPPIERISANIAENRTLAALRDLLLPKLMSGDIRVQDAEKDVEAAL